MTRNFFKTNCRNDWNSHFCDVGNVCSLFAQLIGFTAMLPQIYQTWSYQSVDALHVLWPTALVTASITRAFHIFAIEKRELFRVTAVYFPVVYIIFLLEFWLFTRKSSQRKLSFAALCIIMWACLLTIEVSISQPNGPEKLEWITVVLYSINVLPQIMLNINLRTTFGQSSISIFLYSLVSTFNYISVYLLEAHLSYRIMHYMATSLAYINAIQVIWYPKPVIQKKNPISYGTIIDSTDYSVPFEERNEIVQQITEETIKNPSEIEDASRQSLSNETSFGSSTFGRSQTINIVGYFHRFKEKSCCQKILLIFLLSALLLCTIGLGITANTSWAGVGPVLIFGLLFLTSLYRDYVEGSLSCYVFTDIKYKLMGDSM